MVQPGRPRRSESLPTALLDPSCYPHRTGRIRVVETHISWVLLTGDYAYKIKKPVDLGFANFSTLALRKRYCEEELRLNRRLAPDLYLEVVRIRGSIDAPRIGGTGKVLEYAVKMRQFPQAALASRALAQDRFGASDIDALAATMASFHATAPTAPAGGPLGTPAAVLGSALQNFEQMAPLARSPRDRRALQRLRQWTEKEHAGCLDAFEARKSAGLVCECHGDLHLGNIALLEGRPVPFDCIEFNDDFRFIDVMSETAFLVMDLMDRKRADLAWRFLNRYLEATGDYGGVAVVRFYIVYRALVRAKVHLMRAHQPDVGSPEKRRLIDCFRVYLRLAERCAARSTGGLIVAHGLSGSGKTTATQSLVELLGAVRLRSDLERKRMHGLGALAATQSAPGAGIYSRAASAATYRRLGQLAREIVRSGYPVVVDAAFLRRTEREAFRALAERLEVPFLILNFRAPLALLRARVAARSARRDDASEADGAVLERQITACEPLTPAEIAASVVLDTTHRPSMRSWRRLLGKRQLAGERPAGAG